MARHDYPCKPDEIWIVKRDILGLSSRMFVSEHTINQLQCVIKQQTTSILALSTVLFFVGCVLLVHILKDVI